MNGYFSISDILVTEERMFVELQQPLPKLGFLSASMKDLNLQVGNKLELPLWLISALCMNQAQLVGCELPKIYRESYREILQADACAVELAKWSQYYYEVGFQLGRVWLINTSTEEARNIIKFLLKIFRVRFRVIMDCERNAVGASALRPQIPILERKLLEQNYLGRQQLINWMIQGVKSIKTSILLSNLKKRQKIDA